MSKRKIVQIDNHRNGVSGTSFYVGIIQDDDNSEKVFITFPEYDEKGRITDIGEVRTAVLDIDLLSKKVIEFGTNSFRGDHYHNQIIEQIQKVDFKHRPAIRVIDKQELFKLQAPSFNFELDEDELLVKALQSGYVSEVDTDKYLINEDYKSEVV